MSNSADIFTESSCCAQLEAKALRLQEALSPLGAPPPTIHASAWIHYRSRVEFRVWHENDDVFFVMFDPNRPREPVRLDVFLPASRRINLLMQELRTQLIASPELRLRLFQVEFLSTLSDDALVTLIYHRPLESRWEDAARALSFSGGAQIIGRSHRQRIVLDRDYVDERLTVAGREFSFRQPEGCFTQPNSVVNCRMLDWAVEACAHGNSDLLELYCGIGNFTVPLAGRFRTVLATEINKSATVAARHNLAANHIDNVFLARLSSTEAAQALARVRAFRRLREFNLEGFNPDTVLVDPPRAGVDPPTLALLSEFRHIVYVSCNLDTLHANLSELIDSHQIDRLALFDQFPYTHHMECGVLLHHR